MLGICSTNFLFPNNASAQYYSETEQIIRETNDLIRGTSNFINTVEQQNQRDKNTLLNACNSGNTKACTELTRKLNQENKRLDYLIEQQRNRNRCGSPVCY